MEPSSTIRNNLYENNNDDAYENHLQSYLSIKKSTEDFDVADLLHFVGDNGTYQKLVMAFLAILSMAIGVVGVNFPFIFYEPDFYCRSDDDTSYLCKQKEACKNPFGYEVNVIRTSIISDYELYCDNISILENGQALYYFIGAFASTALLFFADLFGRLPALYIMCSGFVFGSFISYYSFSLSLIFIGLGISQTCVLASLGITSVYINEIIGKIIRFETS